MVVGISMVPWYWFRVDNWTIGYYDRVEAHYMWRLLHYTILVESTNGCCIFYLIDYFAWMCTYIHIYIYDEYQVPFECYCLSVSLNVIPTRFGFTYEFTAMIKMKRLSFMPTLEVGVVSLTPTKSCTTLRDTIIVICEVHERKLWVHPQTLSLRESTQSHPSFHNASIPHKKNSDAGLLSTNFPACPTMMGEPN